MKIVGNEGHAQLYEFIPSLFSPLAFSIEKISIIRRLRFLYEFLNGGYKVYYLKIGNDFVGYCVVTPGGRRLSLSMKKDIVLGPYFVSPQFRGKGYAKVLVRMTLQNCTYDYKFVYDWIHKSNYASIKTSEACGFVQEGHKLNVVGWTRKLVLDDNGSYLIYKYTRV